MPAVGRRRPRGRNLNERAYAGTIAAQSSFHQQAPLLAPLGTAQAGVAAVNTAGDAGDDAQPREWGWVFGALFEAARPPELSSHPAPHAVSNLGSMKLRIPETVLFDRGRPVKWLGTGSDGRVARRSLQVLGVDQSAAGGSLIASSSDPRYEGFGSNEQWRGGVSGGGGNGAQSSESDAVEQKMTNIRQGFAAFARRVAAEHATAFSAGVVAGKGSAAAAALIDDDPEAPFAVAWYTDGQREVLTRRMFEKVSCQHEWRVQVLAVQSFVAPRNGQLKCGRFETSAHRMARRAPLSNGAQHDMGLSALATALAQFCERAYVALEDHSSVEQQQQGGGSRGTRTGVFTANGGDHWDDGDYDGYSFLGRGGSYMGSPSAASASMVEDPFLSSFGAAGQGGGWGGGGQQQLRQQQQQQQQQVMRATVACLNANFILDAADTLWFSHCDEVRVTLKPAPPKGPPNPARPAGANPAESFPSPDDFSGTAPGGGHDQFGPAAVAEAAHKAGEELRRLCLLAEGRGVSVALGSFKHFDEQGSGLVDAQGLVEGLERLGVGLSDSCAEVLVSSLIAQTKGSPYFSAKDLDAFVHLGALDQGMLKRLEEERRGGDDDEDHDHEDEKGEWEEEREGEMAGEGGDVFNDATQRRPPGLPVDDPTLPGKSEWAGAMGRSKFRAGGEAAGAENWREAAQYGRASLEAEWEGLTQYGKQEGQGGGDGGSNGGLREHLQDLFEERAAVLLPGSSTADAKNSLSRRQAVLEASMRTNLFKQAASHTSDQLRAPQEKRDRLRTPVPGLVEAADLLELTAGQQQRQEQQQVPPNKALKSPRTLDRLDASALVGYASNIYGEEGEFRHGGEGDLRGDAGRGRAPSGAFAASTMQNNSAAAAAAASSSSSSGAQHQPTGLRERALRETVRDAERATGPKGGEAPLLSEWARESSKRMLATVEAKYGVWQEKEQAAEAKRAKKQLRKEHKETRKRVKDAGDGGFSSAWAAAMEGDSSVSTAGNRSLEVGMGPSIVRSASAAVVVAATAAAAAASYSEGGGKEVGEARGAALLVGGGSDDNGRSSGGGSSGGASVLSSIKSPGSLFGDDDDDDDDTLPSLLQEPPPLPLTGGDGGNASTEEGNGAEKTEGSDGDGEDSNDDDHDPFALAADEAEAEEESALLVGGSVGSRPGTGSLGVGDGDSHFLVEEASAPRDELFHAEFGVVVSWRLLEGKAHQPQGDGGAGTKFADKTTQQQRAHLLKSALVLTRGGADMRGTPFLLVATPDATMTLDTLAQSLGPLLVKHPEGALLLLGLPGLPNTHWPKTKALTAANQSRAVGCLLRHLVMSGAIDKERYLRPGVPVFWVGVGSGALSMLHVALTALPRPPPPPATAEKMRRDSALTSQTPFSRGEGGSRNSSCRGSSRGSTRESVGSNSSRGGGGGAGGDRSSGVFMGGFTGHGNTAGLALAAAAAEEDDPLRCLREQTVLFTTINGFAFVDKPLKKATTSFQRLLMRGTYHERLAALASLHFSDAFLGSQADVLKQRATRLLRAKGFPPGFTGSQALPLLQSPMRKLPREPDFARRSRALVLRAFWHSRRTLALEPPPSTSNGKKTSEAGSPTVSPPSSALTATTKRGSFAGGWGALSPPASPSNPWAEPLTRPVSPLASSTTPGGGGDGDLESAPWAAMSGSEGLHALLKGISGDSADVRRDLPLLSAPLLLLHSAEDRWVLPTHQDYVATALLEPPGSEAANLAAATAAAAREAKEEESEEESEGGDTGRRGSSRASVRSRGSSSRQSRGSSSRGSVSGSLRRPSPTSPLTPASPPPCLTPWSEASAAQELVTHASQAILASVANGTYGELSGSHQNHRRPTLASNGSGLSGSGSDTGFSASRSSSVSNASTGFNSSSRSSRSSRVGSVLLTGATTTGSATGSTRPSATDTLEAAGTTYQGGGGVFARVTFKAGHELLQEKRSHVVGLFADLISTANELFHPHRAALDATHAKLKKAREDEAAAVAQQQQQRKSTTGAMSSAQGNGQGRSSSRNSSRAGVGGAGGVGDTDGTRDDEAFLLSGYMDVVDDVHKIHSDSGRRKSVGGGAGADDDAGSDGQASEVTGTAVSRTSPGDAVSKALASQDSLSSDAGSGGDGGGGSGSDDGSSSDGNSSDDDDGSHGRKKKGGKRGGGGGSATGSMSPEEREQALAKNEERKGARAKAGGERAAKKEAQAKKKEGEARQKELGVMRRQKEKEVEGLREQRERELMGNSDKESTAMLNYQEDFVEWEEGAEGARSKATELMASRSQDEVAKLEFDAARLRSKKHEERVKRLREEQERVELSELSVGDATVGSGGYAFVDHKGRLDIDTCGAALARLVNDLFEARQKLVNAFKRQKVAQEQYDSFRGQFEAKQDEIAKGKAFIRQKERVVALGESAAGAEDEIAGLRKQVSKQEYGLSELESLFKARLRMLESANRIAQGLKLVVKERALGVETAVGQVKSASLDMTDAIGMLRLSTETERSECRQREDLHNSMLERRGDVARELKLVSQHTGRFMNSTTWNAGVVQRMETSHLYAHLSKEYRTVKAVVGDLSQMISESKDRVMRMASRMHVLDAQARHVKKLKREVEKCYSRACERSTMDELAWQEKRALEAHEQMVSALQDAELVQRAEDLTSRPSTAGSTVTTANAAMAAGTAATDDFLAPPSSSAPAASPSSSDDQPPDSSTMLLNLTRLKPSSKRTLEEKAWVALDALLNPEHYDAHTSDHEKEELKYDEAYQVWQANRVKSPENVGPLTAETVARILTLPRPAATALPFLRTVEEVEIHRLLMKYSLGRGETFHKTQDQKSQDDRDPLLNETSDDDDDDDDSSSSEDDSGGEEEERRGAPGGGRQMVKPATTTQRKKATVAVRNKRRRSSTSVKKLTGEDLSRAKEEVEAFVKEQLCARVRATPPEELTSEEKLWTSLDKVLNPEHYFFDWRPPQQYGMAMQGLGGFGVSSSSSSNSSRSAQSSAPNSAGEAGTGASKFGSSTVAGEGMVGFNPGPSTSEAPKLGDKYELQRDEYELGFEAKDMTLALDTGWVCPYDAQQLLEMYRKPSGSFKQEEDRKVRTLLEAFYVPPELTALGKERREVASALLAESKALAASLREVEVLHAQELQETGRTSASPSSASKGKKSGKKGEVNRLSVDTAREPQAAGGGRGSAGGFGHQQQQQQQQQPMSPLTPGSAFDTGSSSSVGSSDSSRRRVSFSLSGATPQTANASSSPSKSGRAAAATTLPSPASNSRSTKSAFNRSSSSTHVEDEDEFGDMSHLNQHHNQNQQGEEEEEDLGEDAVDWNRHRVWGGWECVHPAAMGVKSQRAKFPRGSGHEGSGDLAAAQALFRGGSGLHAASYSLSEPLTFRQAKQAEGVERKAAKAKKRERAKALKRRERAKALALKKKHARIEYVVVPTLKQLGEEESLLPLLVPTDRSVTLLQESNLTIEQRKSRSHFFQIGYESDATGHQLPTTRVPPKGGSKGKAAATGLCLKHGQHLLDLMVTVTYQGVFGARGYRLGRVAATLTRLSPTNDPEAPPTNIGYSPYALQELNTMDSHGKVTILHCPNATPLLHSGYQLTVGCASGSEYCVTVTARLAEDAAVAVERQLKYAKSIQQLLPSLSAELEAIWASMRLLERKLVVTGGMMAEAELEANRCERDTEMCNDELVADGNHAEGLELDDEDRAQVFTEIRTLEVEFAHWARIFAVRAGSREATKGVLNRLAETRREILIRKEKIMSELADLRAFVPAAIGVVEGIACAATAALDLNTSFAPSDKLTARWESKAKSKWARVAAMSKALPPTVTPAAEVRRRHVADGFVSLSLDERQWVMVDQGLNPDKYVWIELEEKAEQKKHKLLCDQCRARGVAPPRRRKKKTVNLAVRSFQFSKEEIERIEHTPYSKLTRKEVQVRRLLGKYHDNSQLLRKPDGGTADEKRQKASKRTAAALLGRGGGSGSSSNGVSGGAGDPFDPNRAQRIRSKRLSKQPEDLTTEETEWVSVDQVVNPQLWPAGVLLKRHKDEARFGQGGGAGPKMKPEMKKQLSKAALRLEQSGFVLPFPLEPELAREVKEEHELKKAKERMERRASRKSGGSSMRSSINSSSSSSSSSSADPPLALEGGEESKALTPHSTRRGALVRTSSTALSLAASMSLAAASSPSSSSSSSSSAASSFISAVPKKLSRFSAVLSQAVKSREQSREDSGWRCELDYEQCVEAWGASAHHVVFLSSDERKVHQLLVKISGDASDYQEWVASVSLRNHVLAERKRGVGHIREFPMEKPPAYSVEEGGVAAGGGDGEGPSIDQRCRLLQRELDRCVNNSNAFTDSSVLHGHEQRFPTKVLRIELEREMETVLRAQVLAEERVELLLVEQDEDEDDEEEDGENDGDGENEGAEKNKKKKKKGGVHRTGGKKVSKGAGLAAASAASAVDNKGRKENADSDDEEEDGYGSDEEGRVAEKRFQKVMAKRAAVYKKGLVTKRPEKRYKDVVQKVRELVAHENGVDELEREQTREFQELGFGSCFACMANPCRWKPTVDLKQAKQRRQELGDELHYVRMHPSVERFESVVPSSVARGGSRRYRREALVFELEFEDGGWARDQRLCDIDRELHDAWTTSKAYVEVSALSGFKTLLWVGSARKALEVEHSRLVASTLAAELVNEVLEGMREGWYFGEVESKYEAFGYVPSKSVEGVVRLLKERPQDRGVDVEEDDIDADGNGIPDDALEDDPKWQVSDRKAIQPGDHRDEDLKTTEQNIRFGLFTLTLMYFRAMHLMKKQKKMWVKAEMGGSATGGGDGMSDSDEEKEAEDPEVKGLNEHQKRIRLDKIAAHEAKVAQDMGTAVTGQHRTDVREGQERSEAAGSLYGKVRLENMEKAAAGDLQRLYRGHLARKAARRWAMKRNELWALNALLSACAITGQRVYRGYLGRLYAKETRAEMAEFIAMIRMEEAVNDEEEYWRTHSWQRIQRDLKAAKDRLTGANQEVDEDEAAMAAASQTQTQTEKTGGEEDDDGG